MCRFTKDLLVHVGSTLSYLLSFCVSIINYVTKESEYINPFVVSIVTEDETSDNNRNNITHSKYVLYDVLLLLLFI